MATETNDLVEFIRSVPKAELHLHIEGSLEPELMMELAEENGVTLEFATVEEARAAYSFTNLQTFLDIYYKAASVLQKENDFYRLADAYFQRAAADGVVHVEMFFDPQTHTDRGIDIKEVIGGLKRACDDAMETYGIEAHLIMCFLRHLSAEAAMATLEAALPFKDSILGVGLDSSEVGFPPSIFADVFARAKAEGFHMVAHACEEGPAEYAWEAARDIGVERIDHGVRCEEDPALIEHVIEHGIGFTMCPVSNLKLCVVNDMADLNLKRLLDMGVTLCINSDDPAFFGPSCYIADNYIQATEALNLTADDIEKIAINSFNMSFISDEKKAAHTAAVKAARAAAGV